MLIPSFHWSRCVVPTLLMVGTLTRPLRYALEPVVATVRLPLDAVEAVVVEVLALDRL
jgi:hypothetical protein